MSIIGWIVLYRDLLIWVYQDIADGHTSSVKSWNGFSSDSSSAVLFILMNQLNTVILTLFYMHRLNFALGKILEIFLRSPKFCIFSPSF